MENDDTLGVSYNYMKSYDFLERRTYENTICVIKKDIVNTTNNKEWKRNNEN
jgi:hypothetical protein